VVGCKRARLTAWPLGPMVRCALLQIKSARRGICPRPRTRSCR
jgi:hypothetical protein